jgi:hypothetical protein
VVIPLGRENEKDLKEKKVDISQFEDVENDKNYSAPCVLAYDETDDDEAF